MEHDIIKNHHTIFFKYALLFFGIIITVSSIIPTISLIQEYRATLRQSIEKAKNISRTASDQVSAFIEQQQLLLYNDNNNNNNNLNTNIIQAIENLLKTMFNKKDALGYWFITASDGTILSHPFNYLAKQRTTIIDFAHEKKNNQLHAAMERLLQNPSAPASEIMYNNEITHAHSILISNQIGTTTLILHTVIPHDELPIDSTKTRKTLTLIVIRMLIGLLLLATFILFFVDTIAQSLWIKPTVYSLILVTAIGFLWYIENSYPDYQNRMKMVKNEHQLPLIPQWNQTDNIQIPTGIYLNDLSFKTTCDIEIIGYIWQRYSLKKHKNISRGFILPQASKIKIKEINRSTTADHETIIWRVRAVLGQSLDYITYPFDEKTLSIQLWHKDFNKNITLIPDFNAYRITDPIALPGISSTLSITDWRLMSSFFGYDTHYYNVSFGSYEQSSIGSYIPSDKSAMPELYFNITIKRFLGNILLTQLFPLFVLVLFLFVTLLGLSDFTIFASYATLFFTAIFTHIGFKDKIPFENIVFMESFFLIIYLIIFFLTIFSLIALFDDDFKKRLHKTASITYWPFLLSLITFVTIWYLY